MLTVLMPFPLTARFCLATSANAQVLLDDSFKPSDYGIVTKKSNTDLNDYLDNLVTKWSKDGSLQKLYDRYKLKPSNHTAD